MRVEMTIFGRFPGLNDYIRASHNAGARAKMKRECGEMVELAVVSYGCPDFRPPVTVTVDCYEPNAKRDADNVHSAACKFVLDGLQACGVIGNDNRRWVPQPPGGKVETDGLCPRVEVAIEGEMA